MVNGSVNCHTFYVIDTFPVEALFYSEFLNPHECTVTYASTSRLRVGQLSWPACISHFGAYGRAHSSGSTTAGGVPLVPHPLGAPVLTGNFGQPSPPPARAALPLVPHVILLRSARLTAAGSPCVEPLPPRHFA